MQILRHGPRTYLKNPQNNNVPLARYPLKFVKELQKALTEYGQVY